MNVEAEDFWARGVRALATARLLVASDSDASASRAYYAAFYAVSAVFALEGRTFTRHTALEAAVHRDLVKTGRWATELGADFSLLRGLRSTADYGGGTHVSPEEAVVALEAADRIVAMARASGPFVME